jgi:hypothetical protein
MLGDILSLDGVTDAVLYENVGDEEDSNGIPAHGTWLVVEGGANTEIADIIYQNKSYGSNLKGGVTVNIVTASNGLFVAKFDRPTAQDLYIRFQIQRTVPLYVFNLTIVKDYLVDNLIYEIGEFAETSLVTSSAVMGIATQGGGGVPINVEISDDGVTWSDFMEVPTLASKWTLDAANIEITVI